MKVRLLSILAVIFAGFLAVIIVISNYLSTENEYKHNIELARANAEKKIPYNAHMYYQRAFAIRCDDEAVYKEDLVQAEMLGSNLYIPTVKKYIEYFPMSSDAYDLNIKMYYEQQSYRTVIDLALEAREKGIASEYARDRYMECFYMIKNVKSGMDEAQSFIGNFARIKIGEAYGYMNQSGNFLLAPLYGEASPMIAGYAAVFEKGEWCMINEGGYVVARTNTPVEFMSARVGGKIAVSKGGKYGYTDSSMTVPNELPYDYATVFKGGIAAVKKGTKWALINTNEQQITEYLFDEVVLDEFGACQNNGVIFVKVGNGYYMVNVMGQKITEQAFENVRPFASNEPAAVCLDGKWGFVNSDGTMAVQPMYEDAMSYSVGLAAVLQDGKWGYISSSGDERIPAKYEDCKPFTPNGIAAVKEDGVWKYIQLFGYCK